ncbi:MULTISPECIES: permease-like cell division protein FtsX [unclassified Streptococcus]|uniref:permease-like cell division protein FtsX n=1 Tax=unclassified Streptococcus TaxID=2608887 RepID=UPI00359DDBD8
MIRPFRHFWEAVKGLIRNGLMSVIATSSVSLTLTLLAFFSVIIINAERLTTGVEGNVQINTFLLYESTDNNETIVNDRGETVPNPDYHKVYDQIMALPDVDQITFSSKDEQLVALKQTMGEAWEIYDQDNPLSDIYIVSTKTPDSVKSVTAAIEKIAGVDSVSYGGLKAEALFKLADTVRIWGVGITALILVMAIFFISNTIRMTIISRSREIQIMRLVGAKSGYIRGPFFIEGALVGLLGAIMPALLVYFGYHFAYSEWNPGLVVQNLSLYPPVPFLYYVVGGLFAVGIVIGAIGSSLSVRKYLKF